MNDVEKVAENILDELTARIPNVSAVTGVQESESLAQPVVSVEKLVHYAENNTVVATLKMHNLATKESDVEAWSLLELGSKSFMHSLIKKGYTRKEARVLSEVVQRNVRAILDVNDGSIVQETHSALGWFMIQGNMGFKADKVFLPDSIINSDYVGNYSIVSQGDFGTYQKMLDDYVQGQTSLEAVCSMGTAATAIHYANIMWGVSIDNAVNHLVGTSSTGKSTAAALFVSFGSAPFGAGSLTLTFLSTDNALLAQVANIWGYPVAIDELSTSGRRKLTELIYALANGTGKVRCTAGGSGLCGDERFCTTFLSTGETGIIKRCLKTEGISARVFEYENEVWTKGAAEASQIKAIVKENYGFVTPMVAKELLENGESWHAVFSSWQERIRTRIVNEKLVLGTADRLTDVVALYMTSSEIFNAVMKVEFNVEEVFSFFFTHIIFKNAEDANMGVRAYDAILNHFRRFKEERYVDADAAMLMPVDGKPNYLMPQDTEGLVVTASKIYRDKEGNPYNSYILFPTDILEQILENNRFPDAKVTMKAMHNDGLLKTKDANREYVEVYLNDIKTRAYAVLFNDKRYYIPDEVN